MHAEIAQLVEVIEVTPMNQALVDRLKECRFPELWNASTIDSVISYSIHATKDRLTWNCVESILRIVLGGMEPSELHKAADLSRENMRWIDANDWRTQLHGLVLAFSEVTTV